ncbi:membrane protein insertase YidC [Actinotalea sp. K2]|uniref:membrane protein insertase YidC n=1 Tax=Actinotalea sp. K2 TaxID=2939438 RepID=UPI0027DFFDFF|nr:membrane protein insertase YidC [Actinotalea sp. K2]
MNWFDTILFPLKWVVAWIMVGFHDVLTAVGLPSESGVTWALSIVGLVIVIRILLIPLFVKQIKASRGMQLLAPDMQKIQKKYKGKTDPASREALSRETMELYKKHGTNPFSSCLPILAQSPIFFALFRVLFSLGDLAEGNYAGGDNIGRLTQDLAIEANNATLFGAQISETFLGSTSVNVKIVTVVLIFLMSATTFTTQRQLTQKNMPASALQGPMAQQQKMLLYVLPLVFAVTGVNFPIGVLIYWTTTNLWSMGQQFYVIRRNPTPGSEAERALKERRAKKAAAKGIILEDEKPAEPEKPRGQRPQPKRKKRPRPVTEGSAAAQGQPEGSDEADDTESSQEATGTGPAPSTAGTGERPRKPRRPAADGSASSATGTPRTGAPRSGTAKGGAGKPGGPRSGSPKTGGTKPGTGKPRPERAPGSAPRTSGAGEGGTQGDGEPGSRPPRTPKKK